MILGASRTPFQRPAAASGGFLPKLPNTGFYSHFHPLTQVTHAMSAEPMYMPPLVPSMGPHALPPVPVAAPAVPAPVGPAAVAPVVPKAGGVAGGFGGSGFGSSGAMQHAHVDPYRVMRLGIMAPGTMASGANIRAGVRNAGDRVHRSMPFQTAPLPPPPPVLPPAVVTSTALAPSVPATGVKGFLGALGDHLGFPAPWWRRRRSPMQTSCETLGPRSDGLFVTICGGRVTQVKDSAGNVHDNPF